MREITVFLMCNNCDRDSTVTLEGKANDVFFCPACGSDRVVVDGDIRETDDYE